MRATRRDVQAPIEGLTTPPRDITQADLHVWVDYAELCCLVSADRALSLSDLVDDISDSDDIQVLEWESEDTSPSVAGGDIETLLTSKAEDIFVHVSHRKSALTEEAYPFFLSDDGREFRCIANDEFNAKHRFYLFMLLAACSKYVATAKRPTVWAAFEKFSNVVFAEMLPRRAEVRSFGKSISGIPHYTGNIEAKIEALAKDLNAVPGAYVSEFPKHSTGDGGLDHVGWLPTGDTSAGLFIAFGGSACGRDWAVKQASSGGERWIKNLQLRATPVNICFIPYYERDDRGNWTNTNYIESVLMDRRRILHILDESDEDALPSEARALVEEVAAYRRDVYE